MNRSDVYESVTNRIIETIEQGAKEWHMPWHRSGVSRPLNALTKKSYRGVNVGPGEGSAGYTFLRRESGYCIDERSDPTPPL